MSSIFLHLVRGSLAITALYKSIYLLTYLLQCLFCIKLQIEIPNILSSTVSTVPFRFDHVNVNHTDSAEFCEEQGRNHVFKVGGSNSLV